MKRVLAKFIKYFAAVALLCFVAFLALDYAYPLDTKALKRENSLILFDKNGQIIALRPSSDEIWRFEAKDVPQTLKDSVILFEDKFFYYHIGVNPFAMIRAAAHNLTHSNRIGASTITMQVARMMKRDERTYANKFKEIFTALQLEWHYSKDEILDFYFNLAPYGGNIEGAAAAARFYFGKDLSELSIAECALLSTIPKNPNANRLDKKSNINALKNRAIKLLYKAGTIDQSAFTRAQREPFKNKRYDAVYKARHYAAQALKNGVTHSNLDLNLQILLENAIKNTAASLKSKDANNAAGIIIDNKNMSVAAYVGSHDWRAAQGQNDGVTMSRFFGIISATEALALSLNIPAVSLNTKLGENSLYELLSRVHLVSRPKEFYADSIALGSAEMSLLSLAHLYTIYANGGELKPLEVAGKTLPGYGRLISPQSAYLTSKMLSSASRSYLGVAWQYAENTPQIAFKTGTSYGSRDIYTIGVNSDYTVAVWFGNFNGKKTQNLSGFSDASRTVFDVFKLLAQKQKLSFMSAPGGIESKKTCLDAFKFKECKDEEDDWLIEGVELKDVCESIRSEEVGFLLKNGAITQADIKDSPCYYKFKSYKPLVAMPTNNQILLSDENLTKVMLKCYAYIGDEIYLKIDENEWEKVKNASENTLNLTQGKHKLGCLDENSNLNEINIEIRRF